MVYTPSELNKATRLHLEAGFPTLWIQGEVSNLSRPASGHVYFTIKDDRAQIRCALFRNKALLVNAVFKNGEEIIVKGRISLYEPRGDYQLIADFLETAGTGQLQQRYEALKKKLHVEGVFDDQNKQVLPAIPMTIGVISSATGAAIQDFLNVLQRRWPLAKVILYSSSVQGEQAPFELRNALQRAIQHARVDVLVLTRGGGSLEDLWAFNDENLVRDIAECPLPTVSAIGHEIDFTLADFAADVRAATPSAAAELISPDNDLLKQTLQKTRRRLLQIMDNMLLQASQRLDYIRRHMNRAQPSEQLKQQQQQLESCQRRLISHLNQTLREYRQRLVHLQHELQQTNPLYAVQIQQQQLQQLRHRALHAMQNRLSHSAQTLQQQQRALKALGPDSVLRRGYALVLDRQQQALHTADQFSLNDPVDLQFLAFSVSATVNQVDSGKHLDQLTHPQDAENSD